MCQNGHERSRLKIGTQFNRSICLFGGVSERLIGMISREGQQLSNFAPCFCHSFYSPALCDLCNTVVGTAKEKLRGIPPATIVCVICEIGHKRERTSHGGTSTDTWETQTHIDESQSLVWLAGATRIKSAEWNIEWSRMVVSIRWRPQLAHHAGLYSSLWWNLPMFSFEIRQFRNFHCQMKASMCCGLICARAKFGYSGWTQWTYRLSSKSGDSNQNSRFGRFSAQIG